MKKTAVFLTALVFATSVFSQSPDAQTKEKIAVYVTGSVGADEKKALGTKILVELINSGRYRAVERSDDFVRELDREQSKQMSGAVDDNQITDIGKQFGVQVICVADLTPVFGSNQISARLIDVESAEIMAIADVSNPLETMDDLTEASKGVVRVLLGLGKSKSYNYSRKDIKRGYGVSTLWSFSVSSKGMDELWGFGIPLGFAASIPIFIDRLTFEPELDFTFKGGKAVYLHVNNNYYYYSDTTYSPGGYFEYGLSLPLIVRMTTLPPPKTAFYADAGLQLDILFNSDIADRKSTDFGFVWGAGFTWTPRKGLRSSFGYRNVINVTDIVGKRKIGSLIQHSIVLKKIYY